MISPYRHALAKYSPRLLRSVVYKSLYKRLKDQYTISPEKFRGKRILVVGPANTVFDDLKSIDYSIIDIVVRMKNGIHTSLDLWNEDSLRCDVLFHSFGSGSQPVTLDDINHAGVKWIVHRTLKKSAFLDTLQAEEKFGNSAKVKIVPYEHYGVLSKRLGGYAPSTGMVCADFFLDAPFKSLAFVGFTFFSTRYVAGYNDQITSDAAALSKVKDAGHHSPSHEAQLIGDRIKEARAAGRSVYVSESMQRAMDGFRARRGA
ncbi:hypothetical protein [Paracoccus sp. PAMC 22219]|uniref:hypothetical protein n=1 Tax=Paracoccus sp. PAMC 22219 TaxID=1569209 RepID=UPI0018CD0D9D|nr:hypothetical protein [Paracoccus sp. PAMC 22219]